jgi:hypothetical protein
MVTGFNTNIEYQGEVYHVQTESEGTGSVVVITFLFRAGAALLSRKTTYLGAVCGETPEEMVKEWMKEQHKKVLKELVAGKIPLLVGSQATGTI